MKSGSANKGTSSIKQRARADRVQAELPITVGNQSGKVLDISATGVYFEIADEKIPGSQVNFTIDLTTPGGPLQVQCTGEVVRVQKGDGKFGIAVKITHSEMK